MMALAAQARQMASGFGRWWLGELRGCVPRQLLRLVAPAGDRLLAEVAGDDLVLRLVSGSNVQELGRCPRRLAGEAGGAEPLRRLLDGLDRSGSRTVVLRLPASAALRKTIDLPDAAAENLRDVLAFDMERQTPFSPDQVYFDGEIASRDAERKRIRVALVVVPRAAADPLIEWLQAAGMPCDEIEVAAGGAAPPAIIPLLREKRSAHGRRAPRRIAIGLAVIAAGLAAAAVVIPLERQQRFGAALAADVAQARKQADALRQMREEVDTLTKLEDFLIDKKRARPPVVVVVDGLTQVLPDDTWLFRVRVVGDEVQTFGYSAAASNLIQPIDTSPLFKEPQFRAPLMREPRVDAERFHIGLQLEQRPTETRP
jgi:general secretion pathway protein L